MTRRIYSILLMTIIAIGLSACADGGATPPAQSQQGTVSLNNPIELRLSTRTDPFRNPGMGMLAFSADGAFLATAGNSIASEDDAKNGGYIWTLPSGKLVQRTSYVMAADAQSYFLAFMGSRHVLANAAPQYGFLNVDLGKDEGKVGSFTPEPGIGDVLGKGADNRGLRSFFDDSNTAVNWAGTQLLGSPLRDKNDQLSDIGLWDVEKGTLLRRIPTPPADSYFHPRFSRDNQRFTLSAAKGDQPPLIMVWDIAKGQQLSEWKPASRGILNDDGSIYIASDDTLWDVATQKHLPMSGKGVVAITADNRRAVTRVGDRFEVHAIPDGQKLGEFGFAADNIATAKPTRALQVYAISRDGRFFAAGSGSDRTIWVWSLTDIR